MFGFKNDWSQLYEDEIAKYTVNKPQIDEDDELGIRFHDSGMFNFMIKGSDLGFGNWKRAFGYLHSL